MLFNQSYNSLKYHYEFIFYEAKENRVSFSKTCKGLKSDRIIEF